MMTNKTKTKILLFGSILLFSFTILADYSASNLTIKRNDWSAILYGFAELDMIYDSTQSFTELRGNGPVASSGTYAGDHGQMIFSVRNSRIGFKFAAPEMHRMKASAVLEMDFRGNQPSPSSELAIFTSPTFRARHVYFKMETPVVDLLIGQTWGLFGWQADYHPNTVQYQGLPGQIFSRTPQFRVSKTLHFSDLTLDMAVAMVKPPQAAGSAPDGQAGIKIALDSWKALHTIAIAGTGLHSLSLGVSGTVRRFELASPAGSDSAMAMTGWGVAVDAFVPIITASEKHKENSLALLGEYAYGSGTADLYSGMSNAMLPNKSSVGGVDPGTVYLNPGLTLVNWQSYHAGVEYYLPFWEGNMWIASNYGGMYSNNTNASSYWVDVNLFADVLPNVRFGLEYAYIHSTTADQAQGTDNRVQLSGLYMF